MINDMIRSDKPIFAIVISVSIIGLFGVIVECQTEVTTSTQLTITIPTGLTWGNSRISKIIEYHAFNIRQFFCRRGGVTPEEWAKIKIECINPRINEMIPESTAKVWQQCSQLIVDLCDNQQWSDSKECTREALAGKNVREIQMWYRGKLRQINRNVQEIRMCAKLQRQQQKT